MQLKVPADKAVAAVEEAQEHLPAHLSWLFDYSLADNEVWRLLALVVSVLVALALGRLLRSALNSASRRLAATPRILLAVSCAALARTTTFVSLIVGLNIGVQFLIFRPPVDSAVDLSTSLLLAIAAGYVAYSLVDVVDHWLRRLSSGRSSKLDEMLVPIVTTSLRIGVAILLLVQLATIVSDKPVTSVIAGLGVGGLAIGLAAQDTIKNFFGSLMIFSDRPFELGEEIKVGDIDGTVEAVGFRSTRLRTGDGFLVTFPNGDLAAKTVVNVSKRSNLGRQFNLALAPDQAVDKIEQAVAIVRGILENHEGQKPNLPPRVFLTDVTPTGLNLAISYWYSPPDWWRFVAFNERVNLEILRRLAGAQVRLALPAQTVRLQEPPAPEPSSPEPQSGDKRAAPQP